MTDDPIVAEVRAVRENLSRRFHYEIHAIFEDLRSREKTQGRRLVVPPRTKADARPASASTPGR